MPRQSVYQTVSRPTTSIEQLKQHGQSIWLDFIGRGVVRQGDLQKVGIDLDKIAEQWQAQSGAAFAVSLDNVLTTLDRRRSAGPDHERGGQPCLP